MPVNSKQRPKLARFKRKSNITTEKLNIKLDKVEDSNSENRADLSLPETLKEREKSSIQSTAQSKWLEESNLVPSTSLDTHTSPKELTRISLISEAVMSIKSANVLWSEGGHNNSDGEMQTMMTLDYVGLVPAPLATPKDDTDVQKNINIEQHQGNVVTDVQIMATLDTRQTTLWSVFTVVLSMLWHRQLRPMAAGVMPMLARFLVPLLWMGVGLGVSLLVQRVSRPDTYDAVPRQRTLNELQIIKDINYVIKYAYRTIDYLIGEYRGTPNHRPRG